MILAAKDTKVRTEHLARQAYLYVRQSTLRQVFENTESTARQYDLRRRAVALGWAEEQIMVIDSDLGQSGASAVDREGFQRLVSEVGLGRAGIVMGLEVSRLARNSSDWHRLLEICALRGTLILDEDGLYDPVDFNDRLLLGLKGTMSEVELHMIRARLRGGMLNKARRGELRFRLPVGFVNDVQGRAVLDPDRQVQESVRLLFATFRRVGSVHRAVKAFREQGLTLPRPLSAREIRQLSPEVVAEIDHLLNHHTEREVAKLLNDRGFVSGTGKAFDARRVQVIRRAYGLATREQRLHAQGLLSLEDVAARLGLHKETVKRHRREGRLPLRCHRVDDNNRFMYEDPDARRAEDRARSVDHSEEVQYA